MFDTHPFRLISRSELPAQWPRLRALLQPAVEQGNGELDVDDILDLSLQGRMFVFASDAFAVTGEVVHYPQRTVFLVGFGAGKVPERRHVADVLTDSAHWLGASAIQTHCKNPAMTRYYRRWFHLDPLYTVLEKRL